MTNLHRALWLVAIALLIAPSLATAEEAPDPVDAEEVRAFTLDDVFADTRTEDPPRDSLSESDVDQLTEVMTAAIQTEQSGDHLGARDHYVDAYVIFPHSNIVLAIARTSANAEDYPAAVKAYDMYLERNPDGEEAEEVQRRADAYRELLPAELDEDEDEDEEPQEEREPFLANLPQPSVLGWAGLGLTVVGVGAMIGGGRTASGMDDRFAELEGTIEAEDREAYDRVSGEISSAQTRGRVFLYGGMLLTAGGVGLLTYDLLLNQGQADAPPPREPGMSWDLGPTGPGEFQVQVILRY